jgi:alpha-ketoglutarate-dependent taurine dioxygenase
MEWRSGDVALVDNLALAHYAEPDTQLSRDSGAGLRILHRTTVRRAARAALRR